MYFSFPRDKDLFLHLCKTAEKIIVLYVLVCRFLEGNGTRKECRLIGGVFKPSPLVKIRVFVGCALTSYQPEKVSKVNFHDWKI
jgi:hypothetical protein